MYNYLSFLAVITRKNIIGSIGTISTERHKKLLHNLSQYLIQLIDPSENSQANIYKALRPVLADSVSTKKSVFDIVTDSLEQKNT
jgi:transcription antitermination factor NusA-like protein